MFKRALVGGIRLHSRQRGERWTKEFDRPQRKKVKSDKSEMRKAARGKREGTKEIVVTNKSRARGSVDRTKQVGFSLINLPVSLACLDRTAGKPRCTEANKTGKGRWRENNLRGVWRLKSPSPRKKKKIEEEKNYAYRIKKKKMRGKNKKKRWKVEKEKWRR